MLVDNNPESTSTQIGPDIYIDRDTTIPIGHIYVIWLGPLPWKQIAPDCNPFPLLFPKLLHWYPEAQGVFMTIDPFFQPTTYYCKHNIIQRPRPCIHFKVLIQPIIDRFPLVVQDTIDWTLAYGDEVHYFALDDFEVLQESN